MSRASAAEHGIAHWAIARLQEISTEPSGNEIQHGTEYVQIYEVLAVVLGDGAVLAGSTVSMRTFVLDEDFDVLTAWKVPGSHHFTHMKDGEAFFGLIFVREDGDRFIGPSYVWAGNFPPALTHPNMRFLCGTERETGPGFMPFRVSPLYTYDFDDLVALGVFTSVLSPNLSEIDDETLIGHVCDAERAVRLAVLNELTLRAGVDWDLVVDRLLNCETIAVAEQVVDTHLLASRPGWARSPDRFRMIQRWYEDAPSGAELMQINRYFGERASSGGADPAEVFADAVRALEMTHWFERFQGNFEKQSVLRGVYSLFEPLFEDPHYGPGAFELLLDELEARRAKDEAEPPYALDTGVGTTLQLSVQLELAKPLMSVEQRRRFDAIRVDSRRVDEQVASSREARESRMQREAQRREYEAQQAEAKRLLDARHGIEKLPLDEFMRYISDAQAKAWVALVLEAPVEQAAAMLVNKDPAQRSIGVWLCVLQRRYDLLSSNRQLMDDAGIGLRARSVGVVGTGPSEFSVGELYRDQYVRKVLGHWDWARMTRSELDALYPGPVDHSRSVDAWSRRLRTAYALAGRSPEFEGVLDAEFSMLGNAPEDVRRAALLVARMSGSLPPRTAEIDGALEGMRARGGEFELSDPVSARKEFHYRKTFERWLAQRDGGRSSN